jgi:AcrR family transcriptional regulator
METMPREGSKREAVLESGLALASELGLEGLTIGDLAEAVDMTRGGLYAHFDSKDEILREILREAVGRFVEEGVRPALQAPRGEPRVRTLFEAWLEWTKAPPLPGGCVFISSATELDDRPGPLRDYLVATQREWRATLRRAAALAQEEGDFRADLEPEQFVYELFAVVLAFHYFDRLFGDTEAEARARQAFDALVERARTTGGGT